MFDMATWLSLFFRSGCGDRIEAPGTDHRNRFGYLTGHLDPPWVMENFAVDLSFYLRGDGTYSEEGRVSCWNRQNHKRMVADRRYDYGDPISSSRFSPARRSLGSILHLPLKKANGAAPAS
jgi:hypothetical protein